MNGPIQYGLSTPPGNSSDSDSLISHFESDAATAIFCSRCPARFTEDRRKYPAGQFYDVEYADFVADPLGIVTDVYRHFDLT
ncbi:sulfotransferase, partial [Kibdelosporangium lantanae]